MAITVPDDPRRSSLAQYSLTRTLEPTDGLFSTALIPSSNTRRYGRYGSESLVRHIMEDQYQELLFDNGLVIFVYQRETFAGLHVCVLGI